MEKENLRSTLPAQPADPARRLSSEDEIDLVELFYVLWGHVWQIALCLILGAALAFGYTYFLAEPQYKATSSIYIVSASNNSVVNLTDLQIGAQLTADYQELLLSRPLLEDVIQNLGLDLSTGSLANMISISNASDTRILKITVTSANPQLSADIANELVDQACIYLPQIMETEEPNLVESAIPPASKSGPSYPKNTVFGALAANDAIHAANPSLSSDQLAGMPTDSGLPYEINGMLNNLYHQIFSAETVEHLLDQLAPDAAAEFETAVGEKAGSYTPIALYHVGASPRAEAAIAEHGSVRVAVSVPGVADDTRLAAVCWDHNGKSRVTDARVSGGAVYLTVHSAGPVMILARAQS